MLLSTWLNERKSRSIRSGGMPIPVSRTAKAKVAGVPGRDGVNGSTTRTEISTSPVSVNFTALLRRLTRICLTRVTSPSTTAGTSGSICATRSMPRAVACAATRSSEPSTQSRSTNGCRSSSSSPDSIFEKSRTSLMIVSSESPLRRTVSVNSRC